MACWPYKTPSHYLNRRLIFTNAVINLPVANRVIFGGQRLGTTLLILSINIHLSGENTLLLFQKYGEFVRYHILSTMHDIYLHLSDVFFLIYFNIGILGYSVACSGFLISFHTDQIRIRPQGFKAVHLSNGTFRRWPLVSGTQAWKTKRYSAITLLNSHRKCVYWEGQIMYYVNLWKNKFYTRNNDINMQ